MSSLAASIRSLGVTPISSGVSTGADQVRPPSSDFEMARWLGTPLQPPGEGRLGLARRAAQPVEGDVEGPAGVDGQVRVATHGPVAGALSHVTSRLDPHP